MRMGIRFEVDYDNFGSTRTDLALAIFKVGLKEENGSVTDASTGVKNEEESTDGVTEALSISCRDFSCPLSLYVVFFLELLLEHSYIT